MRNNGRYVQLITSRVRQAKKIRIRLGNHVLYLRKITVDDLLRVNLYPDLYQTEKSEEQELANDIYSMAKTSTENDNMLEVRKLIYMCLLKVKGNVSTLPRVLRSEKNTEEVYNKLLWYSLSKLSIDKVVKSKLTDIYNLYQSKNYAVEYYGQGYLNKLEELSFNLAVHREGIKQKNSKKEMS